MQWRTLQLLREKEIQVTFAREIFSGNDNIVRTFWERKTSIGKLNYHSYVNQWFSYVLQTFLNWQPKAMSHPLQFGLGAADTTRNRALRNRRNLKDFISPASMSEQEL